MDADVEMRALNRPTTVVDDDEDTNFTSRPYQDYMIELTLRRNTIIFLPTGAGKTFIALQTINRMSKVLEKSLADGGKRSVFLVNTIVLAKQQAAWMSLLTPLRVACYTGDMDLENWSRERWLDEFERHQVFVATCQIIVDVVQHGYISIGQLNVMVFDECHNATRNHPMAQMMAAYQRFDGPDSERPRIVGMSGTLLGNQVREHSVLDDLARLERLFDATITTVASAEQFVNVLLFSTKPTERFLKYDEEMVFVYDETKKHISTLVTDFLAIANTWPLGNATVVTTKTSFRSGQVKLTKFMRSLFTDFEYQLSDLGMYGASLAIMSLLVELEIKKRACESTIQRQLCRLAITVAERIRHTIVENWQVRVNAEPPAAVSTALVAESADTDCEPSAAPTTTPIDSPKIILRESSSKVLALISFLTAHMCQLPDGADLKGLIFVQRRQTAKILYHLLRNYAAANPADFPIRPDFMVGSNSSLSESIQTVLDNRWNQGVLDRFKRCVTNLIVATSVLEEGVDLQECNLVVCYDGPASYRAYMQSKGRARMEDSTYAIMVSTLRYPQMVGTLNEYQRVERVLGEYLVGKTINRKVPAGRAAKHIEGIGGVLRTRTGAALNALGAMALVNRYVQTLPTDLYCKSLVAWQLVDSSGAAYGFHVRMRLPTQSPVKECFVGAQPASDVIEAKRVAAMQACRHLYECGELDDHLMPFTRGRIERAVHRLYFSHWDGDRFAGDAEVLSRDGGGGTGTIHRMHEIVCAEPLSGCLPLAGSEAHLYCIGLEPEAADGSGASNANATANATAKSAASVEFHRLFGDCSTGFGILSGKPLPACAPFTVHSALGPIRVHIEERPVGVQLANNNDDGGDELAQLRRFHEYVFADVLNIRQPFLASDHDNLEHAYVIVPIVRGATATAPAAIDWPLVQQFQQPVRLLDGDAVAADRDADFVARKKAKIQYRAGDYIGRVVYPWYRMDRDKRYIVVRVHEHLTPFSPFPNEAFASYAAYIEDKYQLRVAEPEQFMLEVQCINDGDLNGLVRNAPKQFASRGGAEMLIPELCQNLAFPGGQWLKATLLPTIVHRLQQLQGAEWLRKVLNAQLTIPLSAAAGADAYRPWPVVEQLNRNPATHKDPDDIIPSRAIVIPNPEEAPVREIGRDEFRSLAHCVDAPWQSQMEPLDFSRHLLDSFPFEVDYFFNFINDRFGRLQLHEQPSNSAFPAAPAPKAAGAICDAADAGATPSIRMLTLDGVSETRGFDQSTLLAALTTPDAKDIVDHRRRAHLGDAVIRFLAAVDLLRAHRTWHLGWLQCAHQLRCGGRNLAYVGIGAGLAGRIGCHQFAARNDWAPPLQCVPRAVQTAMRQLDASAHSLFRLQLDAEERRTGVLHEATMYAFVESFLNEDGGGAIKDSATTTASPADASMASFLGVQRVADDAVADCVRALCGESAAIVGLRQTVHVMRYLGVLPRPPDDGAADDDLLVGELRLARIPNAGASDEVIDRLLVNRTQLERKLGYTFRDRGYLLQALTHISFPDNPYTDCAQALTFLGVGLCDVLLTAYIAERADHLAADELRDLRAALVSNIALACYCVRAGLHVHMLAANQSLSEKVATFVTFQEQHGNVLNDRVLLLIEECDARMGEFVDVPAPVGALFAAIMAAVYLDCGRDLVRVWECLWPLVSNDVQRTMWHVPAGVVQRLEEWPGAKPRFERAHVEEDIVMVAVRFTSGAEVVQVHGFGQTAAEAKVAAAKVALHSLMQ